MSRPALSLTAPAGETISPAAAKKLIREACPITEYHGQRVLVIVPDGTRTAPIGMIFQPLYSQLAPVTGALDVLVALGTHQPMTEEAICERLEISLEDRRTLYGRAEFLNHAWNDPAELKSVGVLPAADIRRLAEPALPPEIREQALDDLCAEDVEVEVNRRLFDYDEIIIIGPVFPHEVIGFSGGNKYLFPGVSGPKILNFFHWLGALITTPRIIGHQQTAVRQVVDRAAALVDVPKRCFALVVSGSELAGLHFGTPEAAWAEASGLSEQRHIVYKERPFHTILSCAPTMYDELWTAAKCMYKLEPVLADGGELIIYAPHLKEVCATHGAVIREIGYHCRDYFLAQWDRFKQYPRGVLAHSTHVHGLGTFRDGVEQRRARVTLASQIPEAECRALNLGYRDPAGINPDDYANREDEGVLLVPKAGETLYRLTDPPEWASV
jgi:nickel-dependent lactate racemase